MNLLNLGWRCSMLWLDMTELLVDRSRIEHNCCSVLVLRRRRLLLWRMLLGRRLVPSASVDVDCLRLEIGDSSPARCRRSLLRRLLLLSRLVPSASVDVDCLRLEIGHTSGRRRRCLRRSLLLLLPIRRGCLTLATLGLAARVVWLTGWRSVHWHRHSLATLIGVRGAGHRRNGCVGHQVEAIERFHRQCLRMS